MNGIRLKKFKTFFNSNRFMKKILKVLDNINLELFEGDILGITGQTEPERLLCLKLFWI